MAVKKVQLKGVINNTLTDIYPKTTADNVIMNSGKTVEQAITELSTAVGTLNTNYSNLTAKLYLDTVYMKDTNNTTITDGDGTGLVAVY